MPPLDVQVHPEPPPPRSQLKRPPEFVHCQSPFPPALGPGHWRPPPDPGQVYSPPGALGGEGAVQWVLVPYWVGTFWQVQ